MCSEPKKKFGGRDIPPPYQRGGRVGRCDGRGCTFCPLLACGAFLGGGAVPQNILHFISSSDVDNLENRGNSLLAVRVSFPSLIFSCGVYPNGAVSLRKPFPGHSFCKLCPKLRGVTPSAPIFEGSTDTPSFLFIPAPLGSWLGLAFFSRLFFQARTPSCSLGLDRSVRHPPSHPRPPNDVGQWWGGGVGGIPPPGPGGRPLLDNRGKRVWEIMVCDPRRTFEHSEYVPNNKVSSPPPT